LQSNQESAISTMALFGTAEQAAEIGLIAASGKRPGAKAR
jgi:hypothetical protein